MRTNTRRERLLNILHRGPTTVLALAQHFGVSERTIYRDVDYLRTEGHDVQATPGPGGGLRILRDSRPRAVHFEVSEIIGLALSVAILKATPHMPFARSAEAALDRACRALSMERQRAMQQLQRRILVGGPVSDQVSSSLGHMDDTLLDVFEQCFTSGLMMTFTYTNRDGVLSSRRIECIAIALHTPVWYILAWDLDQDASRIFRMDRIASPMCGELLKTRHELEEVMETLSPEQTAESIRRGWTRTPLGQFPPHT